MFYLKFSLFFLFLYGIILLILHNIFKEVAVMQTGALIVAAGKSSRMGDFKPMLQLGSISIAQRVINNFRQAESLK